MAMLMLGNDMPRLYTAQRENRWDGHFLTIVEGKTALIVGCGKQGSAVAKAAQRLGVRAVGVDPVVAEKEGFEKIVSVEKLNQILPEADFVFLTMPSTKETYHFFGPEQFAMMKEMCIRDRRGRGGSSKIPPDPQWNSSRAFYGGHSGRRKKRCPDGNGNYPRRADYLYFGVGIDQWARRRRKLYRGGL